MSAHWLINNGLKSFRLRLFEKCPAIWRNLTAPSCNQPVNTVNSSTLEQTIRIGSKPLNSFGRHNESWSIGSNSVSPIGSVKERNSHSRLVCGPKTSRTKGKKLMKRLTKKEMDEWKEEEPAGVLAKSRGNGIFFRRSGNAARMPPR